MIQNVYEFREKGKEIEAEIETETSFQVTSQVIVDICNLINELEMAAYSSHEYLKIRKKFVEIFKEVRAKRENI